MALPMREQAKYWGVATAVFLFVLWWLGDVILPFILGGAIAYCLDPIADRLERMGLPRLAATVVITLVAILSFTVLALLVIPTLVSQATQLFNTAPAMLSSFQAFLTERFPSIMDEGGPVQSALQTAGETIRERGGALLNGVIGSLSGLVNVLVLFVIVPVVTFYLLLDWDRMVARIDNLLPRDHAGTIRRLAREVDGTLAAFIRGQGTVMLILGAFYAIALMLVGLRFGLVIGFAAGLMSFIPYVGAIVGGGLALGMAVFQFWGDWVWIAVVGGVFAAGQMLEGNVLTPKLVGGSVGLHPVWLIFALSAFGAVFGFVGLLVAVPVAAALGVLTRFAIEQYKNSKLYSGLGTDPDAPDD